ncbi:MAG TPA: DUF397 domain-containing protein [Amycolatopsis sp.]|nr:DUF397 domain-containing protein [Amycolatopsis sp.]
MADRELTWFKSSRSGNNDKSDCVEVAFASQVTAVRDSKTPSAGHLMLSRAAWSSFLGSVRPRT